MNALDFLILHKFLLAWTVAVSLTIGMIYYVAVRDKCYNCGKKTAFLKGTPARCRCCRKNLVIKSKIAYNSPRVWRKMISLKLKMHGFITSRTSV